MVLSASSRSDSFSVPEPLQVQRALIVDDQPDLLRLFSLWLRGSCASAVARDAVSALTMLAEQSFDAIVTDYDMPGHTGLWLLERVRERAPAIRRVLMSGTERASFRAAIDSGLVAMFVQKPLDRGSFLQALRVGPLDVAVHANGNDPVDARATGAMAGGDDSVTRELRAALALELRVRVVLGGDPAAGRPVRVCEGTPSGFRFSADGRPRVVLTVSEGIEQLVLVERIIRVARA